MSIGSGHRPVRNALVRLRRGWRIAAAGLFAALLCPGQALATPSPALKAALERFQTACSTALTNPDAYIASLTLPGPAGEDGLYQSPDQQYLHVHTAQSEGLTDSVEYTGLADRLQRSCRIEAVLPNFPEAAEIDGALKPLLEVRATEIVGGRTDTVEPIWDPGDAPLAYEGDASFRYRATGLIAGVDTIASIVIRTGSVTFAATQTIEVENTQ